jgi:AAA domain
VSFSTDILASEASNVKSTGHEICDTLTPTDEVPPPDPPDDGDRKPTRNDLDQEIFEDTERNIKKFERQGELIIRYRRGEITRQELDFGCDAWDGEGDLSEAFTKFADAWYAAEQTVPVQEKQVEGLYQQWMISQEKLRALKDVVRRHRTDPYNVCPEYYGRLLKMSQPELQIKYRKWGQKDNAPQIIADQIIADLELGLEEGVWGTDGSEPGNNKPVTSDEKRPDRNTFGSIEFVVSEGDDAANGPGYKREVTARELLAMDLPNARWALPGLVPEGLSTLAGKPKLGKSWLALLISMGVATGGNVLNRPVEQGDALYLALEDNPRRMKRRLRKILGAGKAGPDRLHIRFDWPRQDKGGLTALEEWFQSHPETRLIVIDTWKRFRPAGAVRANAYDTDYDAAAQVQGLAVKYGVAVLLVHHTRKPKAGESSVNLAEDFLDSVNGSYGFTGALDGVLVLERSRGQADGVLCVTGRDVEEEQKLALKWDKDKCVWSLVGDAEEVQRSQERQEVIDVINDAGTPLTPMEVASRLSKGRLAVRKLMSRMTKDGQLYVIGHGLYSTRPAETPQPSSTPPSSESGPPAL